jgi:hypothetical protein
MDYNAINAKRSLQLLLIRMLQLQKLHMKNMTGSTYSVVQTLAKSIFDTPLWARSQTFLQLDSLLFNLLGKLF